MMGTLKGKANGDTYSAARVGSNASLKSSGEAALEKIVGKCPAVVKLKDMIKIVSRSPNGSVLITGETGTGKELVAEALHACSPRSSGPLIKVNCAAIPESLFESQFFGHKKGVFSGAINNQEGMVQAAINGVLFLDEISCLRLEHQAKLLRFLQDGSFLKLGARRERYSNAWVIAATNRSLEDLHKQGRFRDDLLVRLRVWDIRLPPLRDRDRDVILLARHFLRQFAEKPSNVAKRLSADVKKIFLTYTWPGNIRQLKASVQVSQRVTDEIAILPCHLPHEVRTNGKTVNRSNGSLLSLQAVEKQHISDVLHSTDFNLKRTAQILGIDRNTLKRKIARYTIPNVQSAPPA